MTNRNEFETRTPDPLPTRQRIARRQWGLFLVASGCLVLLTGLLLVYALVPLEAWLALLVGIAIVLAGTGLLIAIGLATGASAAWEPGEWK